MSDHSPAYCMRCGIPHHGRCRREPPSSTYIAGQDIVVNFQGIEHQGHVENIERNGWIRCRIAIQPVADYGAITARMAPHSTVCVRASDVRPLNDVAECP
jgi:hypothetical protein